MPPPPAPPLVRQTAIPDPHELPRIFSTDGTCGGCGARGAMPGVILLDHPLLAALVASGASHRTAGAPAVRAPPVPRKPPAQLALLGSEALTYRPAPAPHADFAPGADAAVYDPPPPGPLPRGPFRAGTYTPTTTHLCATCTRLAVAALVLHGQPVPPGYAWAGGPA